MRDKERMHDYRFMPEPNLPVLRVYETRPETKPEEGPEEHDQYVCIDEMRALLPELPAASRERLVQEYDIRRDYAIIIVVSATPETLCNYYSGKCNSGNTVQLL